MPNLLPLAKKLNRENNIGLSRGGVVLAAKAMEDRCAGWSQEDAERYCLDFWDETGEFAIRNVQKERNKANAARRLATV